MPFPTRFSAQLAEIETAAAVISISLTTMHRSERASQFDRDQTRRELFRRLQSFVDLVVDVANEQ